MLQLICAAALESIAPSPHYLYYLYMDNLDQTCANSVAKFNDKI